MELLRRGIGDFHRRVGPDDLVGLLLGVHGPLPGNLRVVVDGDRLRAHVEAYVVAVVIPAQDSGENVLSGMLLHMVEPPVPVKDAGDGFPDFHFFFKRVENHPAFFMDVQYPDAVQRPVVGGLSAALRIEGGAVQNGQKAVFFPFTGENSGGKFFQKGVLFVELFRFHVENFLSDS